MNAQERYEAALRRVQRDRPSRSRSGAASAALPGCRTRRYDQHRARRGDADSVGRGAPGQPDRLGRRRGGRCRDRAPIAGGADQTRGRLVISEPCTRDPSGAWVPAVCLPPEVFDALASLARAAAQVDVGRQKTTALRPRVA